MAKTVADVMAMVKENEIKFVDFRFTDTRDGASRETTTFKYAGGIIDFVKHNNASKEALFKKVGYFEHVEEDRDESGSRPRTTYELTRAGKKAFKEYIDVLEAIVRAAKPD